MCWKAIDARAIDRTRTVEVHHVHVIVCAIGKISRSLWMPHGIVAQYEHSREHENERKLLRNEGARCQRACHLCFSTAVWMKRMNRRFAVDV